MKAIRTTFTRSTVQSQRLRNARTGLRTHTLTALLTTRTYCRHSITQVKHVNAHTDGTASWFGGYVLLSSFHRLSKHTVKTRIVGQGLRARQFSSGRNCGNANVNQLGRNVLVGSEARMTIESSTSCPTHNFSPTKQTTFSLTSLTLTDSHFRLKLRDS